MSITDYLPTPIAAHLASIGETELAALAGAGRIKRYGGRHGFFAQADIEALRGRPITPDDLTFAEAQHARRLASYAKQNERRKTAHAAA